MKLDRMIGILSLLLQRDRVTAPELAERFEVSRRTILRDIDALCQAGIPIQSRQGAGGGHSIMEGYPLDRAVLSSAETRSILAGLRSLDSVSGTRQYARLMERLAPSGPQALQGDDCVLIDLASWYREPLSEKIGLIRGAIDEGRSVEFRYYAPTGESLRTVEPYYIVFHWAGWYVYGFCATRRDWRLFKLNRMAELSIGERFERRDAPYPDFSDQRVFPARYHARVRLRPEYKWRLVEEYGPECFITETDGSLLFEGDFTDRDYLISWVLSFQNGAELLEPADLRAELARLGEAITRRYGD